MVLEGGREGRTRRLLPLQGRHGYHIDRQGTEEGHEAASLIYLPARLLAVLAWWWVGGWLWQEGREPHALLEVQYRLLQRAVIDKLRQPLGGKLQISPVGE